MGTVVLHVAYFLDMEREILVELVLITSQGEQKCIKGVHSKNTSRNLKCTLSIHFTTEKCCERCGKT